jgi:hypothetical protein
MAGESEPRGAHLAVILQQIWKSEESVKRNTGPRKNALQAAPVNLDSLLGQLRTLITQARQQALRAVDVVQVRTCWEMGRHIVEYEQGGAERAQYGARLLPRLAERLSAEFGKGFDERNLRHMRAFFQTFPIWDALRSELSWTHYRLLLRVEDRRAREWYMVEAASQNWGSRALERQIGTLYYERLLGHWNVRSARCIMNACWPAGTGRRCVRKQAETSLPLSKVHGNSSVIRCCWNFWDCLTPESYSNQNWNRP